MRITSYIVSLLVLVTSCSFLDEAPRTSFSESSAYATETALEASLTGCYAAFQGSGMFQGEMAEYLQYCSQLVHWKSSRTSQQWTQTLNLTMYSNSSNNYKMFTQLYSAVYKCNKLISSLEDSPVDEAYKTEVGAEARLLRAILYFTLVRMYGDVPLILEPAADAEQASVPRTFYCQVYEQILSDLEYAEEYMRDEARQAQVTGTAGRPHKWAATSFKSLVYLQIACMLENPDEQWFDTSKEGRAPDFTACGITTSSQAWKKALDTAESVIESGVYKLADRYTDLFRWTSPEDYQLKERIFVLQSTDNGTTGNYMAVRTLPEYPGGTLNTTTKNNNSGRIRPERFVFQKWAATYGGQKIESRADNVKNIYVSCPDPRFDATYIHTSYYNQLEKKDVALYPAEKCVRNSYTKEAYFRKYLTPLYDVGSGYADFYMMRYAEIILIAAEASASLSAGPGDEYWTKALGYVEQIHARARRSVPEGESPASQPMWTATKFNMSEADFDRGVKDSRDKLIKAIMWERVFELGCEGHEFFDSHRRGVSYIIDEITTPMNEFLDRAPQSYGSKSYKSVLFNGQPLPVEPSEVRKGLLLAFPEEEIRFNPAIGPEHQNDFYIL